LIDRRNDSAGGIFMTQGDVPFLLLVPLRSTHHLLTTCSLSPAQELQSSSLWHSGRINRPENTITN